VNPAWSRHCDRVKEAAGANGASHWGRHRAPGKVRPTNPGSQETCPRPAKTTLEERVA